MADFRRGGGIANNHQCAVAAIPTMSLGKSPSLTNARKT
jgi:hypothetical protein